VAAEFEQKFLLDEFVEALLFGKRRLLEYDDSSKDKALEE
jgi:hypothetical protein